MSEMRAADPEFPNFADHHDAGELIEYLHRRDADAVSELLDARSATERLGLLHGLIDLLHETRSELPIRATYEEVLAAHVAAFPSSDD